MLILPVRNDILTNNPTRLDLNEIENLMLWPHDASQRMAARLAALAEFEAHRIKQAAERHSFVSIQTSELHEMVDFLRRTPRLEDIQCASRQAYIKGLHTGFILFEFIGRSHMQPTTAGLQRIKQEIAKRFSNKESRVSLATVVKSWQERKCVSPQWAAHVALTLEARPNEYPFPCKLGDLAKFLTLSEFYRKQGLERRGSQAPGTVLAPGQCYEVPAEIQLPPISINWELKTVEL